MSAIGDYVHATAMGYYGFGAKKTPYISGYAAAAERRRSLLASFNSKARINTTVKKQLKKELQETLFLLKSLQEMDKNDITEEQLHAQLLFDELAENLTSYLSNVDINTLVSTNAIQGSSGYVAGQNAYYNSTDWENQVNALFTTTMQEIDSLLTSVTTEGSLQRVKVESKLQDIQNSKGALLKKMAEIGYSQGGKSKRLQKVVNQYFSKIKNYIGNSNKFDKKTSKELGQILKNFIDAVKKRNLASNYSGTIGEQMVKIIGPQIDTLARGTADQEIYSEVIGNKTSKRGFGNISSQYVDLESLTKGRRYTLIEDQNVYVTATAVQEKIDVVIYPKEDKSNGIFASVKNYNTEGLEKVPFKSTNIMFLISNENGKDFVNHYLNLQTINYTGNESNKWNSYRKESAQYMKKIILQKLLSGQGTAVWDSSSKRSMMDAANVFIVINSDTFKVKVFNMGDLLEMVQNNNRYLNQDSLLPDLPIIKNPLSTYSSARERITDILRPLMGPTEITVNINELED